MKTWQQAARDSLIPGVTAGMATLSTVALSGYQDSHSLVAPINASSHVMWGDEAARVEQVTLRHTLPGVVINLGASIWWAFVFEKLFGDRVARNGLPSALLAGAATSTMAYALDYKVLPKRLTPGWEARISQRSLFLGMASMAAGLAVGAWLMRGR